MSIEGCFRQAACAPAQPAAGTLVVTAITRKQVAWDERLLEVDCQGVRHCLDKRMGGTSLAVDHAANGGPGHAGVCRKPGTSLKAVAIDMDHHSLNPVVQAWPRPTQGDSCRSVRCVPFRPLFSMFLAFFSMFLGHEPPLARRVNEAILPNNNRTSNMCCMRAAAKRACSLHQTCRAFLAVYESVFSMPLPVPSALAVASFHDLFLARFGIDLSPKDSQELATHTLQLFYLKHYPHKPPMRAAMTKEETLYYEMKQTYETGQDKLKQEELTG